MDTHFNAAIKWLCESDIRNKDKHQPSFGGINNGYFWKNKTYQYVYNEITGYAVNAFLAMYKWLNDDKYLQYSKDAADYLINQQEKNTNAFENGAIFHSLTFPDLKKVRNYYSFDNAIVLHGMVNLYKITNENKYLDACIDIGNWLLRMQKKDGSFYSYFDAENNVIDHRYDEFFFDNGCLHVKNTIGLMYLNHITNGDRYYNASIKLCDWGGRLQDRDGLFWANTRKKYVFTHAHCYATEGYLYAYYLSKKPKYLDIAKKAGEALIALQNNDGSLFRIYKNKLTMKRLNEDYRLSFSRWRKEKKYPWKTMDATAQAARIWTLLYRIDNQEKFLNPAKKAIHFITQNQVLDGNDQNMFGGFYYQLSDKPGKNKLNEGMYTWCTQFGLSALMLYQSIQNNTKLDDLIEMLF
jgi:rhamnogalacturonyl hydrolase YesR